MLKNKLTTSVPYFCIFLKTQITLLGLYLYILYNT
ncbi:hypothetical protein GGQ60_001484 [Pedobacter zeae]|uniref:Uncharacterized protein n=1 Tax=Pedobacter zeae TaxID=1737356 RepID=A0A7W6K966_9SPHI|nr:hypothetical protein [Pedobacter zeae]